MLLVLQQILVLNPRVDHVGYWTSQAKAKLRVWQGIKLAEMINKSYITNTNWSSDECMKTQLGLYKVHALKPSENMKVVWDHKFMIFHV